MKKFLLLFLFLICFAAAAEDSHECTSWMVFSDMTGNGTNILHKNRDNRNPGAALIMSKPGAKRKWIGISRAQDTKTAMGFNSSGLACVVNSGEKTDFYSRNEKGAITVSIIYTILNECDTAAQAVEKLKKFVADGNYRHGKSGSIFIFMDANEGYVCEMTGHFVAVRKYDRNYVFRANLWRFPEMAEFSSTPAKKIPGNGIREYAVRRALNAALKKNGKIDIADITSLSRDSKQYGGEASKSAVCGRGTISSLSMVINKKYPDVLSYGMALLGHPRHVIAVPVPICIEKILPSMQNGTWGKISYERLAELDFNAEIPAEWLNFESESRKKFDTALSDAEKLLDNGKKADAVKLLNKTAMDIWQDAEKLILAGKIKK